MANLPFSYSIRRSPRVSRMRITVTPDKIEVVAPPKVAEALLHQFVNDKQQWILQARQKVAGNNRPAAFPLPATYGEGTPIPYRGGQYPLRLVRYPNKRVKISFNGELTAQIPAHLPPEAHSAALKPALVAWLKQQARQHVGQALEHHTATQQLIPQSVLIKTQKSRWGSCGIHNDININWLLIMAPPEVLEYVVVHELCHIQIRNHSAQFWALVAEHLPGYQSQRQWLKQQGGELLRYGFGLMG